jgi:hypothetical protein
VVLHARRCHLNPILLWANYYSINSSPRFRLPSKVFTALVVRVNVEDEHEIFCFKIAADRRKMSNAGPEYSLAAKVYDVAALGSFERRKCCRNSSSLKSRRTVILCRGLARATSANSSKVRPRMQKPVQHRPVPASTLPSVFAVSPNERYALATEAGPQREIFDCYISCRLNVPATGKCHARSKSSGVRVTDEAIACGDTLD